jgi:hypothetical protein
MRIMRGLIRLTMKDKRQFKMKDRQWWCKDKGIQWRTTKIKLQRLIGWNKKILKEGATIRKMGLIINLNRLIVIQMKGRFSIIITKENIIKAERKTSKSNYTNKEDLVIKNSNHRGLLQWMKAGEILLRER